MIKKNPVATFTDAELTAGQLSPILGYINGDAARKKLERSRADAKAHVEHYERRQKDEARNAKISMEELTKVEAKIAALGEPVKHSEKEATAILDAIAALPWVKDIDINEPNPGWIQVRTRPNSLFTTFAERWVVRKDAGVGYLESMKPKKLPLPPYKIALNLEDLKAYITNGGSLCKNNTKFLVKLTYVTSSEDMAPEMANIFGFEPHAHFASNDSRGEYGQICLGEYAKEINIAFTKGLVEGFEAFAAYLQQAGSVQAYRTKRNWIAMLGNPLYNKELIREEKEGDDEETIKGAHAEYMRDKNMLKYV